MASAGNNPLAFINRFLNQEKDGEIKMYKLPDGTQSRFKFEMHPILRSAH
jgi:hypothetical protein